MLTEMQSVDTTQISQRSPCLLIFRMFLLQRGENHTKESKTSRIKNAAERFTKVGKKGADFYRVA